MFRTRAEFIVFQTLVAYRPLGHRKIFEDNPDERKVPMPLLIKFPIDMAELTKLSIPEAPEGAAQLRLVIPVNTFYGSPQGP